VLNIFLILVQTVTKIVTIYIFCNSDLPISL